MHGCPTLITEQAGQECCSIERTVTAETFNIGCSIYALSNSNVPLTPSVPVVPNYCCSKGLVPYWSNPPFLISDIWALWHSVLSAQMSKIKNGALDQYGKV